MTADRDGTLNATGSPCIHNHLCLGAGEGRWRPHNGHHSVSAMIRKISVLQVSLVPFRVIAPAFCRAVKAWLTFGSAGTNQQGEFTLRDAKVELDIRILGA